MNSIARLALILPLIIVFKSQIISRSPPVCDLF